VKRRIGTHLLLHAFERVEAISKSAGVWALTLDAVDEQAAVYYERFDFKRSSPTDELEMYLPLGTILTLLETVRAERENITTASSA
jgi:hypothetical protein